MPVALLGPDGTFSAQAGYSNADRRRYDIEPIWCSRISECFNCVLDGSAETAIVPFVNSTSSAYQVNETLARLRDYGWDGDIRVRDEEVVPISLQLAALPGASIDGIRYVSSKDKALQQCTHLREILGHEYKPVPADSTASAAASLAEKGALDWAVVVPSRAAALYGLQILACDIQDNKSNYTRFHAVGRHDHERTGSDATKVMFEYNEVERAGLLHDTTGALDGVNMRYLQLLAIDGSLTRLTFFVDLDGHREDDDIASILASLEKKDYMKRLAILGSYPVSPDI
ncbi:MAG: hypothetical protein JXC85_06475 [Candidatus Aenigmarchaeota archaeon]|nr:hypothetical protein [Candidatus Aenigmarchaeota archaeon]